MYKKIPALTILLFTTFGLFLVWYFLDDIKGIPHAPSIETHQWRTYINVSDLQIRKVRNNETSFLLKPTERTESDLDKTDGAYQYDTASKQFKLVSQEFWANAEGEIKTCHINDPSPDYKTYGWHPLTSAMSNSRKVGVVSATGPKLPSIFSFLPGQSVSKILGMRYFEIFYTQKELSKSEPVRLGKIEDLDLCWTPDENFVVIYDIFFINFSVIDVQAIEKQ